MPFLIIAIDITKGRLVDAETHDAELSAILQQTHSAMVMRALPQALFDTERTIVGEVRYQERAPFTFYTEERDEPPPPPIGGKRNTLAPKKGDLKGHEIKGQPAAGSTASRRLSYPPAVSYPSVPRQARDMRGKRGKP